MAQWQDSAATDMTITPGQTAVKAVHWTELRTALSVVYADAGLPAPSYGEALSAGATVIKAGHLVELRAAIVSLPSCSYTLEPGTLFVGAAVSTGGVHVATFGGCEWTASGGGFAPLTGPSSFSGSGTALFAISANTATSARSTTVVVAGQSVVVNQAGAGDPGSDPPPQSPGRARGHRGGVFPHGRDRVRADGDGRVGSRAAPL